MTMNARSDGGVLEEAARWQARLAAPDCTSRDRATFEAWRRQDPAHAQASDTAVEVSELVAELAASDPTLRALADEAFAQRAQPSSRSHARQWVVPVGLAASALLTALLVNFSSARWASEAHAPTHLVATANRRDIRLADGSLVRLDVDTAVDVMLQDRLRSIELVRGRAIFEVAHDSSRPFVVSAGSARVTALGTRFQVRRNEDAITVTLTEGSVAVSDAVAAERTETLRPGEQLTLSRSSGSSGKVAIDSQVVTSWSQGRHVFKGTPLSEAIEEVNRYAARKVRLGDPDLAGWTVGGSFVTGDSASVVAAFAAVLPLRVVEAGNELILFRRADPGFH